MKIKLDHVNIGVKNLKESIEWYQKIFGFQKVESGVTPTGQSWAIVASNDSMVCMTEYPDEMLEKGRGQISSHRIFHFGIRVSDESIWQEILTSNNLNLYYGGKNEYPFSSSWYIQDPTGHEIEVSCLKSGDKFRFPEDTIQ